MYKALEKAKNLSLQYIEIYQDGGDGTSAELHENILRLLDDVEEEQKKAIQELQESIGQQDVKMKRKWQLFYRAEEWQKIKVIIESWENPYPKDIFIEPTKKQYAKFHKILQKDNLTLDKFSGAIGRGIYYAIKEKILKAIEVKE